MFCPTTFFGRPENWKEGFFSDRGISPRKSGQRLRRSGNLCVCGHASVCLVDQHSVARSSVDLRPAETAERGEGEEDNIFGFCQQIRRFAFAKKTSVKKKTLFCAKTTCLLRGFAEDA